MVWEFTCTSPEMLTSEFGKIIHYPMEHICSKMGKVFRALLKKESKDWESTDTVMEMSIMEYGKMT
jgi:hypothetical protein